MFSLVYVSSATRPFSGEDLRALLAQKLLLTFKRTM